MIKLSTKWDYAMKSIIYLLKNKDSVIKISDISSDLNISESLLRRIIASLHKSWIVYTKKWRNWWLSLWRDPKSISVYDVLFSVWEELWISECTKWNYCENKDICFTTHIYWNIQKWLNGILKLYTLDKFFIETDNE